MVWQHHIWESTFKFVTGVSKSNTRYVDKTNLYLPTGKHLKQITDNFPTQQQKCKIPFPTILVTETIGAFKHTYLKWCSHNQ